MQWGEGLLLGLALAVDAAVVSFAVGLAARDKGWKTALRLGCWFGGFQGGMALIGLGFASTVSVFEQWGGQASGAVFLLIGAKLLWDAFRSTEVPRAAPVSMRAHMLLALATSLDALAAGVGLVSFSSPSIVVAEIAVVTFVLCAGAAVLSRRVHHLPESFLEIGGAAILIGLGLKALGVKNLL